MPSRRIVPAGGPGSVHGRAPGDDLERDLEPALPAVRLHTVRRVDRRADHGRLVGGAERDPDHDPILRAEPQPQVMLADDAGLLDDERAGLEERRRSTLAERSDPAE